MQSTDKQILIVEDNKRHMDRACDILEQLEDVVIFKADNCADAYRYAMEYSIDLFIVDIILEKTKNGDMSGMTFADNIRDTRQRQLFLQHRWRIQNYTPMHIYIAISILINITEKMNSKKQFSLLLKITQRKRKENIFILKQMVLYAR